MLVRGFYHEGWHPHGEPLKERKKAEFLARVARSFHGGPNVDPERVARAVFQVLAKHVAAGKVEDIKSSQPTDIRALWP